MKYSRNSSKSDNGEVIDSEISGPTYSTLYMYVYDYCTVCVYKHVHMCTCELVHVCTCSMSTDRGQGGGVGSSGHRCSQQCTSDQPVRLCTEKCIHNFI